MDEVKAVEEAILRTLTGLHSTGSNAAKTRFLNRISQATADLWPKLTAGAAGAAPAQAQEVVAPARVAGIDAVGELVQLTLLALEEVRDAAAKDLYLRTLRSAVSETEGSLTNDESRWWTELLALRAACAHSAKTVGRAGRRALHACWREFFPVWLTPKVLLFILIFLLTIFTSTLVPAHIAKLHPPTGSCKGRIREAYLCSSKERYRGKYCLCDPPRRDGGGCNQTDWDGCNAGNKGVFFRWLEELPLEEQHATCLGQPLIHKNHRKPYDKEREACDAKLPRPFWPKALQGCQIVSFLLAVISACLVFRRQGGIGKAARDARVQHATVRIGIYDRKEKKFVSMGSGAVVSTQGHILTAAHCVIGQPPKPIFDPHSRRYITGWEDVEQERLEQLRQEQYDGRSRLIHLIGVGDQAQMHAQEDFARWKYWAEPVTSPAKMAERKPPCPGAGGICPLVRNVRNVWPNTGVVRQDLCRCPMLDLAVLQIRGNLTMDPEEFDEAVKLGETECTITSMPDSASPDLDQLPTPLPIDISGRLMRTHDSIVVAGWASPSDEHRRCSVDRLCCIVCDPKRGQFKSRAWIHSGSSGGPCVNRDGKIVGVVSASDPYNNSIFRAVTELTPEHGLLPDSLPIRSAVKHAKLTWLELSAAPVRLDDWENAGLSIRIDAAAGTYAFEKLTTGDGDGAAAARVEIIGVGRISPLARGGLGDLSALSATQREEVRSAVKCEAGCDFVAFAYPATRSGDGPEVVEQAEMDPLETCGDAIRKHVEGFFFSGGFLYCKPERGGGFTVKGARVIGKLVKDETELRFETPEALDRLADAVALREALIGQDAFSLHDVTYPALLGLGISRFCWLPPGRDDAYRHRCGFAYVYAPSSEGDRAAESNDCVVWMKPPPAQIAPEYVSLAGPDGPPTTRLRRASSRNATQQGLAAVQASRGAAERPARSPARDRVGV